MIDIHTHILPNIDDGAGSVGEAIKMTDTMYKNQIDTAVCTPHFDPSILSLENFIIHRANAFTLMTDSKVKLIAGSETKFHEYLFYYTDLSPLSIGDTDYILLELPFDNKWDAKVFERIDQFIHTYHLLPVIAHIERYKAAKKKNNIKKLMELGCVLQLNASSVINKKTKRRAIGYLRHGYIDIVSSDCHNMNQRPPNLEKAYDIIAMKLGEGCCDRLRANAELVIAGELLLRKSVYTIS